METRLTNQTSGGAKVSDSLRAAGLVALARCVSLARCVGLAGFVALTAGITLVAPVGDETPVGALAAGAADGISIEVTVNDQDADTAPGPTVYAGATISWRYTITVTGDEPLYDLLVTDSSGAKPSCDFTGDGKPDGFPIHPGPVDRGDSFTCTATSKASDQIATHGSVGVVKATNKVGDASFEAQDPTHYSTKPAPTTTTTTTAPTTKPTPPSTSPPSSTKAPSPSPATSQPQPTFGASPDLLAYTDPDLLVELSINNQPAPRNKPPVFPPGTRLSWRAELTNTGNVDLVDITLTAPADLAVKCPGGANSVGSLGPGATVSCTGESVAGLAEANLQSSPFLVEAVAIDPRSGDRIERFTVRRQAHFASAPGPEPLAFTGWSSGVAATLAVALIMLGSGLVTIEIRSRHY